MAVKKVTDPKVIENIRKNYEEKIENKTILESKPLLCVLSINSVCNLKCKHCPSSSKPYARISSRPEIDMRTFPVLEREVFPTLYGLMFSGTLGEPTIAKNFREILRISMKYDYFLELATHGHNLRGEVLDLLLEKHARIRLSFEGAHPKMYESVRGVPMAHLLKNLDNAVKLKEQRNSQMEFIFNYTAWYDNIREFPDFVDLAAKYGSTKVAMHHLNPESEKQRYKSLIYHQSLLNDMVDEAKRRADKHGIEVFGADKFPDPNLPLEDQYANLRQTPREISEFKRTQHRLVLRDKLGREPEEQDFADFRKSIKCHFPWEMIAIVENGNMRPCCWTSRDLGNVPKQGFEPIWNGKTYQKLRATINTDKPPVFCKGCMFLATNMQQQLSNRLGHIDGERIARTPITRFFYIKAHTKTRQFLARDKVVKSKLGKNVIAALKKIKHKFFGVDLR